MKNIFFAIVCFAFISSCGRGSGDSTPPEALPPATQTGANTAGCLINGNLLLPKNGSQAIGGSPQFGLKASFVYDYFYMDLKNYDSGVYLYLYVDNVNNNGIGAYTINQSDGIASPNGINNNTQVYVESGGKIFISGNNAGVVNITRYNFPIISGNFSATLYNKYNALETIEITDGRFDINKNTINTTNFP